MDATTLKNVRLKIAQNKARTHIDVTATLMFRVVTK